MTATAYTNSLADTGKKPGDEDYGITFTGTRARRGTVAVDPKVIPLGSRLWVEGYGMAVAEDVGGAVRGNMVDVFLGDEEACLEWGRKKVEVRVIE
jgi:3D (Asp-Asp-Asp) domain-containing protein